MLLGERILHNQMKGAVEFAIIAIRAGTPEARRAAKEARDQWHACLTRLDSVSERPAAINLHLKYLIDRIEEESLPIDGR
jgi:hypothetical protein